MSGSLIAGRVRERDRHGVRELKRGREIVRLGGRQKDKEGETEEAQNIA